MLRIVMDSGKEYTIKWMDIKELEHTVRNKDGQLKDWGVDIGEGIYIFPKHISEIKVL